MAEKSRSMTFFFLKYDFVVEIYQSLSERIVTYQDTQNFVKVKNILCSAQICICVV